MGGRTSGVRNSVTLTTLGRAGASGHLGVLQLAAVNTSDSRFAEGA